MIAKIANPAKDAIVAAVVARNIKKVKSVLVALLSLVKHKFKNKILESGTANGAASIF